MQTIEEILNKSKQDKNVAVLVKNDYDKLSGLKNSFITPKNGENFNIEELHRHLNCELVEIVSVSEEFILIIDEEGKIKNKYINNIATEIARGSLIQGDYIAGDAIFCNKKMLT